MTLADSCRLTTMAALTQLKFITLMSDSN